MSPLNDIVMITLNDFDTLWYQRQALAAHFAKAGHRVFYFNKTPHRWPGSIQIIKWLVKRTKKSRQDYLSENLRIVKPLWLVPTKILRAINRKLIRQTLKRLDIKNAIVITDVPSYNTLDAIEQICPDKIVYLNVHNYDDSNKITADILDSEKELVQQADFLFADSQFNAERLKIKSDGRKVFRALPGADFELFAKTFRGDEAQKAKTIYFFGMVHDLLDIELYNQFSEYFKVVFIGDLIGDIKRSISKKIEIRPAVSQKILAEQLTEADIIGLFYKQNAYSKGVIPAKIFESIATGKPILISGLEEDSVFSRHVYHFDGTEQAAVEIIKNLPQTETPEKIKDRRDAAKQADWQNRFESFNNIVLSEIKDLPKFSVLMSVYEKDRPEFFRDAMDSILNQTVKADEIVLVKDGPIGIELENIINEYKQKIGDILKIVELKENKGLGIALAEGIKKCTFDIVARMDADDMSAPERFEKQLRFLKNNPDIGVASCFIAAFEDTPQKPLFVRRGPLLHNEIEKQFRLRFCMNHPAAMLRKNAVLDVGNYIPFAGLEDYHLWARMILNGTKMATIGQILYYHRWEKQLLKRRSGIKRTAQQIKLQKEFLKIGFINKPQFLRNVLIRTIASVLPLGLIKRVRIVLGI